ncbi:transposase [Stieleria varia]|uniref:transposase n=1 Tax=Stieleria varia TaxID=2528005 RepID=UPI00313F0CCC
MGCCPDRFDTARDVTHARCTRTRTYLWARGANKTPFPFSKIQGTAPEYRGQSENQHVLGYLAKYVAGVAIGDRRLIRVNDHEVVFDAKDYRDKSHVEVSMPPKEFCYEFSRHILPHGMPRTR